MCLAGSSICVWLNATWIYAPEEDLALWCLLRTSWLCLRGRVRWLEDRVNGRGPSRLRLRCRVCSANSVWISARSRPATQRPFSTRISSPGRRPGDKYGLEKSHGTVFPLGVFPAVLFCTPGKYLACPLR